MLLLSVPFKDVFNYLIFKHAETIQIGERETGGVRASRRLSQAQQKPRAHQQHHRHTTRSRCPNGIHGNELSGKHPPRQGRITHGTYAPGPLARTEDPHAHYSTVIFVSPLCSPTCVANLLLMSPQHNNWERSDIRSET